MATARNASGVWARLRVKRRTALVVGLVALVIGGAAGFALPRSFESHTKVRVLDDRALRDVFGARATNADDATDRIRAIHEEILSRGNLAGLIHDLGLDREVARLPDREQPEERERLIREIERATRIDLVETSRGQFVFRIAHRARDAALAREVVAKLSAGYQERLRRSETEAAGDALSAVRTKIASLESEYRAASDELATFEERNAAHRLGRADDTRSRAASEEEARSAAALELESLEAQLADVRRRLEAEPEWLSIEEEVAKEPIAARIREEIRAAEEELSALREKYTDEHPHVLAQQKKVEQKRKALDEELRRDSRRIRREPNPARLELARAEWELVGAVDVKRRLLADREARLAAVTRLLGPFSGLKEQWEALVDRRASVRAKLSGLRDQEESARIMLQARTAGNAFIFEVLDPPSFPLRPASPDRVLVCLGALALALGAAVTAAFLADILDSTCRTAEEVAGETGLPVLGTIGSIETRAERNATRRRRARARLAVALLALAAGAVWAAQFASGGEIDAVIPRIFG